VTLTDDAEVPAPVVVSGCDPHVTFLRLVEADVLLGDHEQFLLV
jgi:hypothetical protein